MPNVPQHTRRSIVGGQLLKPIRRAAARRRKTGTCTCPRMLHRPFRVQSQREQGRLPPCATARPRAAWSLRASHTRRRFGVTSLTHSTTRRPRCRRTPCLLNTRDECAAHARRSALMAASTITPRRSQRIATLNHKPPTPSTSSSTSTGTASKEGEASSHAMGYSTVGVAKNCVQRTAAGGGGSSSVRSMQRTMAASWVPSMAALTIAAASALVLYRRRYRLKQDALPPRATSCTLQWGHADCECFCHRHPP